MGLYMVDRVCPGATLDQLRRAQRAVIEMSNRFIARGEQVRYLRSTYLPSESRCLCFFEAPDSLTVEEVNEVAKIPFIRVVEAVELTPEP
ncbi:MAG: nickel-binding protein [Dehalococcoidia bacterium]